MINSILQHILFPPEQYIYGTADLTGFIDKNLVRTHMGYLLGSDWMTVLWMRLRMGPTLEYYRHYNQINKELATIAEEIKKELQKLGLMPK